MDDSVKITEDAFQQKIEEVVKEAIDTSDYVIFLTDSQEGLNPYDRVIANQLRPYKEKVLIAVNKTENEGQQMSAGEFYKLGIEPLFYISSTQGIGINDMMEHIFDQLQLKRTKAPRMDDENLKKVSIVGRPNVGKSSIFNAIAGEDKTIVSDVSGTTRDSVDHLITYHKRPYLFIDTAGLKKRNQHTKDAIDFYSYVRTIKAIADCEVCLFVIDASADSISNLDKHIADLILEEGRAMIILVNKWDKVEKDTGSMIQYTKYIYDQLQFASYAPLIYTSAVTKQRLINVFDTIDEIHKNFTKRISTANMNKFLADLKGRPGFDSVFKTDGKIYYMSQVESAPPKFTLFVNNKAHFKVNFTRFIAKHIREHFGFVGCPIEVNYKEKDKEKYKYRRKRQVTSYSKK